MQLGDAVDNRSSRVVLALGNEAIAKMAKYNVGIIGLSPTGSEIIKNLILTGIGQIEINDSENITNFDIGSNFFARDTDISSNSESKKRIDAIPKRLGHLNRSCKVTAVSCPINEEWMSKFNSLILSEIRPFSEISRISNFCHSHNIQFIFATTVGPNAVLFEDFGDNFTCNNPNGEAPLEAHVKRIRKVNEKESILQLDKSEIDVIFPPGSKVRFDDIAGMPQVNGETAKILKLNYPNNDKRQQFEGQFLIGLDTTKYKSFVGSAPIGKVIQVITPQIFNHKPINEVLSNAPSNHHDTDLPIKELIIAISQFWDEKSRPPRLLNIEDAEDLYNRIKTDKDLPQLKKSAMLYSTEYPPTAGMIGGCASMECIKYCTGVALPTYSQWTIIDRSCIIEWEIGHLPKLVGNRYDPIAATVGNEIQEKMRKVNALIVGVGAIGCEYARYAALFGFDRITLIDNDTVELSNLTRQFLFRDKHQGMPKAKVGRLAILKVNSDLKPDKVTAFQDKFMDKTVLKVGRGFDVVFSAVDSATARNFISDYTSARRIPMVNAGMEKYRANFNIYIPFKTQKANYKENQKDSELPCTLKTIPTTPYHLLQWAHNEFVDYFKIQPESAIQCIQKKGQLQNEPRVLRDGVQFLSSQPKDFNDCVQWAFDKFTIAIEYHPMIQLQNNQKVKPCPFDIQNQWHREFVLSAALLKAKVHGLQINSDIEPEKFDDMLKGCKKIPNPIDKDMNTDSEIIDAAALLEKFNTFDYEKISKESIIPIDFDKDNANDIEFIEGFSKSRAEVFSIFMESFSKLKIMKVVGSIAPTLATTTAVAGAGPFSGFSMLFHDLENNNDLLDNTQNLPFLELIKKSKLYDGQLAFNRQIDLSFGGQVPVQRRIKYGTTDKKFCVWDFIDVEDDPTLEDLQEKIRKFLRPDVEFEWMVGDKSIFYSDQNKMHHIVEELKNILKYDDDFYLVDQFCFSLENENEKINLPRLRVFAKHD